MGPVFAALRCVVQAHELPAFLLRELAQAKSTEKPAC